MKIRSFLHFFRLFTIRVAWKGKSKKDLKGGSINSDLKKKITLQALPNHLMVAALQDHFDFNISSD